MHPSLFSNMLSNMHGLFLYKVVRNCLHLKKHACLMCSLKKGQLVLSSNAFYVSAAVLNSAKSRLTANTTLTTHNNFANNFTATTHSSI